MRRGLETGFRSLRELAVAALGGWGFWWQITRVEHPETVPLVLCAVMAGVPGLLWAYRTMVSGLNEDDVRRMLVEEVRRMLAEDRARRERDG